MKTLFTKTFFRQALWFFIALSICFALLIVLARYDETIVSSTPGALMLKMVSTVQAAFGK